jgi:hypothetical protein
MRHGSRRGDTPSRPYPLRRASLEAHREQVKTWIDDEDLTVAKVRDLLGRQGVMVPARTLERFAAQLCGPRRGRGTTVRVADGEPGDELQVDFGRMGLLFDPETERRRVVWAAGGHPFALPTARESTAGGR